MADLPGDELRRAVAVATLRATIESEMGPDEVPAYIDPTASVHPTARIGRGTKVWGNAYIGRGAVVGRDCVIARAVEIGPEVAIGHGCKLEAACQVHQGVGLGNAVFVGPAAVFCNDNDPRAAREPEDPFVPKHTIVGDGAVICAHAVVIAGMTIAAGTKVWPGGVVTHDVPAGHSARSVPAVMKPRRHTGKYLSSDQDAYLEDLARRCKETSHEPVPG